MVVFSPFSCSKLTSQIISLVTCLPFKKSQDQEAAFAQVVASDELKLSGPFLHPIISSSAPVAAHPISSSAPVAAPETAWSVGSQAWTR